MRFKPYENHVTRLCDQAIEDLKAFKKSDAKQFDEENEQVMGDYDEVKFKEYMEEFAKKAPHYGTSDDQLIGIAHRALSETIMALLTSKSVYGYILCRLPIRILPKNHPKINTMAIVYDRHKLYLAVNAYFIAALDDIKSRAAILEHECMHITNLHKERFEGRSGNDNVPIKAKRVTKDENDKVTSEEAKEITQESLTTVKNIAKWRLYNMAADKAINQNIRYVPKHFFVYDVKSKTYSFGSPMIPSEKEQPHREAEYYYNNLMNEVQEKGGFEALIQEFGTSLDEHEIVVEGSGSAKDIKEEAINGQVRDVLEKATKDMKRAGIGNIPGNIESIIAELAKSRIDWRKQLRNFFANTINIKAKKTRSKRNRRYGLMYAGWKRETELHLMVGVDCSGSTYNLLADFFTEIKSIHNAGTKITVVMCDTEVRSVFEYDPKKEIKVTGGGGTLYAPFFKKADELKVDGIIIFGDMDNFDKEKIDKPKIPLLWAIIGNSPQPFSFGRSIKIE